MTALTLTDRDDVLAVVARLRRDLVGARFGFCATNPFTTWRDGLAFGSMTRASSARLAVGGLDAQQCEPGRIVARVGGKDGILYRIDPDAS